MARSAVFCFTLAMAVPLGCLPTERGEADPTPPAGVDDVTPRVLVSKPMSITNVPLTVDIPLDAAFRKAFDAALENDRQTIRLTVRNLLPTTDVSVTGVTVFVQRPTANRETPATDPHAVGTASFLPRKPANGGYTTHVFSLKAALNGANVKAAELKTLSVTFVATADGPVPPGASVPFEELELSVVPLKK